MLLALLLSMVTATPDAQFKSAVTALVTLPSPELRRVTRYLDLTAVPAANRDGFLKALTVALNSTSTSSRFFQPQVIGDLVQIDLAALGWDKDFRTEELRRLEESGIIFKFPSEAAKASYIDIWETIAYYSPYFKATSSFERGWIDPTQFKSAQGLALTNGLVVRADWLFPRLLLEAKDGGFYSQLLLFPTREADLYKRFGQDAAVIDRFNQLRHGAAMVGPSIVALHNRELQEVPSSYGYDYKFIWRTFDFAEDAIDPAKNVFRSLAGTAKHDGREIIGTLPNGLHWYYLSDGAGKQANVVPQTIALDQRDKRGVSNPNVTNAIKCMDCHMPVSGIYKFEDQARKMILSPDIALSVITKGKALTTQFVPVERRPDNGKLKVQYSGTFDEATRARVAVNVKDLEEYYLSDLEGRVDQQNESYARRLLVCSGMKPAESAEAVVSNYNRYHEDNVTLEQAVLEMGQTLEAGRQLLRASGNQDLVLLSTGTQPIRRAAWENGFGDAQRVIAHPWERQK